MNNREFVNLVNALESVYGQFTGMYLCHECNYIHGLDVEFHEVKSNKYKTGIVLIGENSTLNIMVHYEDFYKEFNFIRLITEKGEVIKIDLNEV